MKHRFEVFTGGSVPVAEVLIKSIRHKKHTAKVCDCAHIPVRDVRVEFGLSKE